MRLRCGSRTGRAVGRAALALALGLLLGQTLDSPPHPLERAGYHPRGHAYSCDSFSASSSSRAHYKYFRVRGEDDNRKLRLKLALQTLDTDCRSFHELAVSETNELVHHSFSEDGSRGGGTHEIELASVPILDARLQDLPPEQPSAPGDRRLFLGVPRGDGWKTYVYDRADLPEGVLEILRITLEYMQPWVLEFEPQTSQRSPTSTRGDDRIAQLSPDGRTLVSGGEYTELTVWDVETRTPQRAVHATSGLIVTDLAFSPDGAYLAASSGGKVLILDPRSWETVTTLNLGQDYSSPHLAFTPDGEHLLVQGKNIPAHRVAGSQIWQASDAAIEPRGEDVLAYRVAGWQPLPAHLSALVLRATQVWRPDGRWGLLGLGSGTNERWDRIYRQLHAELDGHGFLAAAAFSPDQRRVAVVTARRMDVYMLDYRLRIWDVVTGTVVRELHPFETRFSHRLEEISWTPDGDYLVGVSEEVRKGSGHQIEVWSLATGRQRGELVGATGAARGLALTPDGKTLIAVDDAGMVHFWDFEGAVKDMAALEASFPPVSR